ncbi:MAG: anthranilate phosphoribosyltransferase [Sedimentisphaerales bacterium]|nr:anthranilate phosphoribosyltransferase [Sedimentisphaerales bacterium]
MAQINEYLEILVSRNDLSFEQATALLDTIFGGEVSEIQVAAFLTAMRTKGVTVPELAGLAGSLREHAVRVETGLDDMIDVVGTGGAKLKVFNISTAAAIVAAGVGAHVAKHGNRGITSKCGAADVLTALGVNVSPGPDVVAECIRTAGVGFMFAPSYHPAMKYVQPVRKALGFRTVFNILGPLANPARVKHQMTGVASEPLMRQVMEAQQMLGMERGMVVHSEGLDEISTMAPTKILSLQDGNITELTIQPEDFGMAKAEFDVLKGGDAETNAAILKAIFSGKDTGPRKDIVVLNAAAAIIVAGRAEDFASGIEQADATIRNGKAQAALEKLVEISNQAG